MLSIYEKITKKIKPTSCLFDFEKKIVDFGKKFNPSGDIDKDMKHITSYFSKFKGKFPENGLNH